MAGNLADGPVIVCGLGHLGRRVVDLLQRLGQRGFIIAPADQVEGPIPGAPAFAFIAGDARDEQRLADAGIGVARAVIIVTDDDLANVSIALNARRLNPASAIVVRLFDQDLAAHLETSGLITRGLSSTALAAPAFAAAALGEQTFASFEIGGAHAVLEELVAGPDTRLEGRAVIARRRGGELHHGMVEDVRPGDRLTCLAFAAPRRRAAVAAVSRPVFTGLREWWGSAPPGVRVALAAFLVIVLFSVALLHATMGLSPVDALYFVITTITTVGYGDYNFQHASPALKLYGVFLMLCGAAVLATLFSIVADVLLGARLRDLLARGCAHYRGHVIVAGLGNLGYRLVRELVRAGETVVAIEQRENGEFVCATREEAAVVLGNARAADTLRRAGVAGARIFVASTDDDLANLSSGLAARRARPDARVVLRVFDAQLAERLLGQVDVDAVLSVSAAAAPTFVGCALCPDARQGLLLKEGLVLIFHRSVRSVEKPAEAGEVPLLVRRGNASYQTAGATHAAQPGDEWIGSRWLPFAERPAAP